MTVRDRQVVGADARGATAVEYTLLVALVCVAAIAGLALLGGAIDEKVDCAADTIAGAAGGPCSASASRSGSRDSRALSAPGDASRQALSTSDDGRPLAHMTTGGDPQRLHIGTTIATTLNGVETVFDAIAGEDEKLSTDELARYASEHPGSVAADAYQHLERYPALMHALDVGAGEGDVDGVVSREDLTALGIALDGADEGEIYDTLADTAAGEGGRDHYVSMPDAKSMYWQLADDPYVLARTSERVSYLLEHGEDPPCSGWLDCTVERAKNVGGLYLNTSDGFMRGVIEPWKRGGRWYLDSWSSCFDGSFDGCANAVATTAIAAAGVALSVMTAGSAGVALAVWVSVVAQAATLSAAGQFHLDYDETALGRVDSAWREWAPRVLDPNRDRDARVRGETIRVSTPVQPGRRLLVPARPRSMPLPDHLRR